MSGRTCHARGCWLAAWGCHGLKDEACFRDARSGEALTAPAVDLFVLTANCEAHSRRNHLQTQADQRASHKDVWASLAYVRNMRPRAVVMENVNEPSTVGAYSRALRARGRGAGPRGGRWRAHVAGAALLAAHPGMSQPGMWRWAASGRTAAHERRGARHEAREGEMRGGPGGRRRP